MFEWILNNWLLSLTGIALLAVVSVFVFLYSRKSTLYRILERSTELHSISIEMSGERVVVAMGRDAAGIVIGGKIQEKPEWYEVLQEELDRLPIGKVAFNPPGTMKLGVKERVETRISRDLDADLMSSLRGRGLPQIEELKISELMKVRLSGDEFSIDPLNEEEQIIEPTGFTEWSWDVTPRKSGKKIIHLHVTLRIRLPFGEERKDHPVLDREIIVQVNPVYSVTSFIVSYWKWIVTALILPSIALVWKTYFG